MVQLDFSIDFFQVGDRVKMIRTIIEPANDCHPAGVLASPDEEVIVRAISNSADRDRFEFCREWPLSVSHDHILDNSFRCGVMEIAPA